MTQATHDIEHTLTQLEHQVGAEHVGELSKRVDALLEALEILARDTYQFPGLDARLRAALRRGERRSRLSAGRPSAGA